MSEPGIRCHDCGCVVLHIDYFERVHPQWEFGPINSLCKFCSTEVRFETSFLCAHLKVCKEFRAFRITLEASKL